LKKPPEKRADEMAEGVGPEFKSQYCKQKKKKKKRKRFLLSTQCPKIVRQAGKNIIICNYLSV
jgi:hypothetical protein